MTCFDENPQLTWWFAMTHPDDEVAIGAWIKRLTRAGCPVHLAWTHSTPIREREGRIAARLLGVQEENLHFFPARDGYVLEDLPRILPLYAEALSFANPDRVVSGAFEQGHIDHDATNYLIGKLFSGERLEIPLYHTYARFKQTINRFAQAEGQHILALDDDEAQFKRKLARCYPDQSIWDTLIWYEIGQFFTGRPVELSLTERMRFQQPTNFMEPNLPKPLADRVKETRKWDRWCKAIEQYESRGL